MFKSELDCDNKADHSSPTWKPISLLRSVNSLIQSNEILLRQKSTGL
jgi:hypothetical protein